MSSGLSSILILRESDSQLAIEKSGNQVQGSVPQPSDILTPTLGRKQLDNVHLDWKNQYFVYPGGAHVKGHGNDSGN